VDIVFILLIVSLYAVSHWITRAISRLGSEP
jgi:HAMP domain-containing protein